MKTRIKSISGRNFTILIFMIGLFSVVEMSGVAHADSLHQNFVEDTSEEFLRISDTKIILTDNYPSQVVELIGWMDSVHIGGIVEITISGNEIEKTYQTHMLKNGVFQIFIEIDSEWRSGTYDVQVNHINETKFVETINVSNQNQHQENVNERMIFLNHLKSINENIEDVSKNFLKISDSEIIVSNSPLGHIVEINGKIDSKQFGYPVEIIISGNEIEKTYQTYRINDGTFQTFIEIDSEWRSGTYDVQVNYINETKFVETINVSNQNVENIKMSTIFFKQMESAKLSKMNEESKNFLKISDLEIVVSEDTPRHIVEIKGIIDSKQFGLPVEIIIFGNEIEKTMSTPKMSDGTFQTFIEIDSEWRSGTYNVQVNYLYENIFAQSLNVSNIFYENQEGIIEEIEVQNIINEIQPLEFEINSVNNLQFSSHNNEVSSLSNDVESTVENNTFFTLTGSTQKSDSEESPIIQIQKDGKLIETLYVSTNNNNEFFVPINTESWASGIYDITVLVGGIEIDSKELVIQQNNITELEIPIISSPDVIPMKQFSSISISESFISKEHVPLRIISGTVSDYSLHQIDIEIYHDSQLIETLKTQGTEEGFFSMPILMDKKWPLGNYNVKAFDTNNLIAETKFTLN
jgi:hypothetical protein